MNIRADLAQHIRHVEAENGQLRAFVEWCARIDQPDPDPSEENARRLLTVDRIAYSARCALDGGFAAADPTPPTPDATKEH